eukprot:Lithocolla_globosa_v1_NODE_1677_length_2403_cov_6.484242.p2 type:complete len:133 gc:universal NODE_1677_length_2403_cov_6.484242:1402-1004(-)
MVPKGVSQGIDGESGMMNKKQAQEPGVEKTTPIISPENARDQAGKDKGSEKGHKEVVLVLKLDQGRSFKVRNVGSKLVFGVGLHQHPAHMTPPKAFLGIVRIKISICITVMDTMSSTPPFDRAFHRCRPTEE